MNKDIEWSLCIPTYRRIEVLKVSISCALAQTNKPREIIVVDASTDWERNATEIQELVAGRGIGLRYLPAAKKSSAAQRNQAISVATTEILFFIDDDTFLHEDSAEQIMRLFAEDLDMRLAGIGGNNCKDIPPIAQKILKSDVRAASGSREDKSNLQGGHSKRSKIQESAPRRVFASLFRRSSIFRVFCREVLMLAMVRMFVPYDRRRTRAVADLCDFGLTINDAYLTPHLPGYAMAVRRDIALKEPFDPVLLAYCPMEDLDASYRWGRYGVCLILNSARVHHFTSESGRIRLDQVIALGITNVAYFVRKNSDSPLSHGLSFIGWHVRRIVAEILKDMMTVSLALPRTKGALVSIPRAVRIFSVKRNDLEEWYASEQRRYLGLQ